MALGRQVRQGQSRLRPIGTGDPYSRRRPWAGIAPAGGTVRELAAASEPVAPAPGTGAAGELSGHQPGPGPPAGGGVRGAERRLVGTVCRHPGCGRLVTVVAAVVRLAEGGEGSALLFRYSWPHGLPLLAG